MEPGHPARTRGRCATSWSKLSTYGGHHHVGAFIFFCGPTMQNAGIGACYLPEA
ncbi:hypothetical protein [Dictyobacter halimunensis]|uniref:hypothetical protein n=1 Tax=Dictyobacter halimunensis TaxID=3026934 RepID=UPI0030C73107